MQHGHKKRDGLGVITLPLVDAVLDVLDTDVVEGAPLVESEDEVGGLRAPEARDLLREDVVVLAEDGPRLEVEEGRLRNERSGLLDGDGGCAIVNRFVQET